MFRQSLFVTSLTLWSAGVLLLPGLAGAETPLNRAIVYRLRNQVRILPQNQAARSARPSDVLTPGDALSTARQSLAELRFNDNSLARIGERALFRFVPNTRSFQLQNGTALLLIPPGRGYTRVRTPNASAGIRGSALFVRYNPSTNTTIVGALTNSQISVSNQDESQTQELKAGQLAVIVQNRIEQIYTFDLRTFYETSELARDLDLPQNQSTLSPDLAIAQVQQETAAAVRDQIPLQGQGVIENPGFIGLNPSLPQAVDDSPTPGSIVPASVDQSPASGVSPVLTGRPTPTTTQGPLPINATVDQPGGAIDQPISGGISNTNNLGDSNSNTNNVNGGTGDNNNVNNGDNNLNNNVNEGSGDNSNTNNVNGGSGDNTGITNNQ